MNQFLHVGLWLNPYRGCTQPKCSVKFTNVIYTSDKKCFDFSLKIPQKRLEAGLDLDPLGQRSPRLGLIG